MIEHKSRIYQLLRICGSIHKSRGFLATAPEGTIKRHLYPSGKICQVILGDFFVPVKLPGSRNKPHLDAL